MAGVILVGDAQLPGARTSVGPGREQVPDAPGRTLRVPGDRPTIQRAVDAARPGDLVLVAAGVYREAVKVVTPYVTIRGVDRDEVILDGEFTKANGIHVLEADGVVVENMTARHYLLNGFYWTGVQGYRASYVTAYGNGDYGVYAFDSVWGVIEHSFASGHPDSGFYIGQCRPCHATIDDVVAVHNGLGYSGTNASGDLWIVNSEWAYNQAGIVPNTLDSETMPPQGQVTIAGNWVHDNDDPTAPAKTAPASAFGSGIVIAGGRQNVIENNRVEGHPSYGIQVTPNVDKNFWMTDGNVVRGNVVGDSGIADLALGAPARGGDCFASNDFATSSPPALEQIAPCGSARARRTGGEPGMSVGMLMRYLDVQGGDYAQGDWRTEPAPPPQQQMPLARTAAVRFAAPETAVPGTRPAPELPVRSLPTRHDKEATMLGFPITATTWWGLLVGIYGYMLPVILYAVWVVIAVWDLLRREDVRQRGRAGWLALIMLVPVVGPLAYYAFGRSPIPGGTRWMLTAGALAVYLIVAALAVVLGS
jgi:hypothetical protein